METNAVQGVGLIANEETILQQFAEQKQLLLDLKDDLEDIIPTLLNAKGIEIASLSFRIKNEDSLRKKIQFKQKYRQLTDVTDLIGCRIVTLFEPDIERVLEALKGEFKLAELVDKRKKSLEDHIDFGYNSLHAIFQFTDTRCELVEYSRYRDVKFEVQIRTALQHAWGEIEHGLGYKSNFEIPLPIRRKLTRIAATLELIDEEFEVIRQEVAAYDQSFEHKIERVLKTDINKNTLIQYFRTGEQAKAYNARLQELYHVPLVDDDAFISRLKIVQRLQFLGLRYIHELDTFIADNRRALELLGEKWVENVQPNSVNVYALLVYVILLASTREAADLYEEDGPMQQIRQAIDAL